MLKAKLEAVNTAAKPCNELTKELNLGLLIAKRTLKGLPRWLGLADAVFIESR